MCKCTFPDGVTVKPDGMHELDPHQYELDGIYTNVTVEILRCKKCGHVSIGWHRQENTEETVGEDIGN